MEKVIAENNSIWTEDHNEYVIGLIRDGNAIKNNSEYRFLREYKVISLGGVDKIAKKNNGLYMATKSEAPVIIRNSHAETGHGGEKVTLAKIKGLYNNIPMAVVKEYISRCEICCEKKRKRETAPGMVFKPIVVEDFNDRAQIDLVNYQTSSDGSYQYLLHYVECLTKYHIVRPLKSKRAKDVADELLNIFLDFGAPVILQSDNGREFTAEIIRSLSDLWPSLKLVNGRPRHPQTQGVVERANADLKKKLQVWMKENKSKNWSQGCRFVQWQMNTIYHSTIRETPYNALFGNNPRCGLTNKIPEHFFLQIGCSDMREEVLESMILEGQHQDSEMPEESNTPVEMSEEDEIPTETPEEEETYLRDDDFECINVQPLSEIEVQVPDHTSSPKRKRSSEEVAEVEHPTKKARLQARAGIKKQAEKMLSRSSRKLLPLSPGDNVAVPVPKFDRSNGDLPNIIGVILTIDENGLYTIGTKSGRIKGKLSRGQFEPISYKGLEDHHVPQDVELSVREIVRAQSICNGQGFTKCNCKGTCLKSCSCFKKGLHCNSACHSKNATQNCKNVDS